MSALTFLRSLLFLSLVSADITFQGFSDDSCESVIETVHANLGDVVASSGCQSFGTFHSVAITSVAPGFVCNVYADSLCQSFLETFSSDGCTPIIGQGVICFDNDLFVNPFALAHAVVSVGNKNADVGVEGSVADLSLKTFDAQLKAAINQACNGGGCDDTNPLTVPFQTTDQTCAALPHGSEDRAGPNCNTSCITTITVKGNYDSANNNERDYMGDLLSFAFTNGAFAVLDLVGILVGVQPVNTFAQVVMNAPNGANLASMEVDIEVDCTPPSVFICTNDDVKGHIESGLGAVPEVGGVAAFLFDAVCAAAGT